MMDRLNSLVSIIPSCSLDADFFCQNQVLNCSGFSRHKSDIQTDGLHLLWGAKTCLHKIIKLCFTADDAKLFKPA